MQRVNYQAYNTNVYKQAHIKFYKSKTWQDTRKQILIAEPLCELCRVKGIVTVATSVDHIVAFRDKYDELAYEPDNLIGLCHKCHVDITNKEKYIKNKLLLLYYVRKCDLKEIREIKYSKRVSFIVNM